MKENCHTRANDDIAMKLGPVTKLYKGKRETSKKFDDEAVSSNCDNIVIFPIFGQFGAIWKPDSGYIACKTYILINSNPLYYKNWKQK